MEFGYQAMKNHARQQEIDALERQRPQLSDIEGVKLIHVGCPLGRMFPAERAAELIAGVDGTVPYSNRVKCLGNSVCVVDYLKNLTLELMELSCSKCVLCREGLRQLHLVFDEVTRGHASVERMTYAKEVTRAMSVGCDCDFGKGAGRMLELAMEDFAEEFDQHIRKKRCPALVCKAFFTVHVLADKCVGCGKCMEVCPEDAIIGKNGYIHMVDQDMCERCGKCLSVCPQNARVKAGRIKPRTPDHLTRVEAAGKSTPEAEGLTALAQLTPEQRKAPYAHFYDLPIPPISPAQQAVLDNGSDMDPADAITAANINLMLHPEQIKVSNGYCLLPDGSGYVAAEHHWPDVTMDMYNFWLDWWTKEDSDTRYKIWCPGEHYGAFFTYSSENIGGRCCEIYFGGSVRPDPRLLGLDIDEMAKSSCVMADGGNALSKYTDERPEVFPLPGLVCHFMYQEEKGLTVRSRFWFGCQAIGGSIVNIMEPGMTIGLDHLKGIFHHNVLEMTRLGDLLPRLYREVVEGKKSKQLIGS